MMYIYIYQLAKQKKKICLPLFPPPAVWRVVIDPIIVEKEEEEEQDPLNARSALVLVLGTLR